MTSARPPLRVATAVPSVRGSPCLLPQSLATLKFSAFFREIALALQGLVGCGPTRESTGDTAGIYARSGTGGDASDGDFSA